MEFHDINQRSPMSICEILSKIEEDTTEMRWGHQRSKLFAEAAELYEKRGDHENLRKMGWEIVLFYLRPLDYDDTKKMATDLHLFLNIQMVQYLQIKKRSQRIK